ncbi:MAG: diguanylate cyclase domain-containing protein [Acidimicrobiales bacterium]
MTTDGFAGYTVVAELAQLGQTLLLRARNGQGVTVLIKTHVTDLPSSDMRERIRREHHVSSLATSDHLAGVHELIDQPTRAALVLDDPGERRLDDLVADGAIDLLGLLDIAVDAADGLAALHRERLVHRAVGPDRIVLASGRNGVLTDLYDAAPAGARPRRDTAGRHPAPEQTATTVPAADPASDQFSLAATIAWAVEMLDIDMPDGLAAVIEVATRADPRQRYRSMLGLRHDLRRVRASVAESGACAELDPVVECPTLAWETPSIQVGRDDVVAQIDAVVGSVEQTTSGRVVVVRGPAGSGRTALLGALSDRLADRGIVSGLGRFVDGGPTLPLRGPLEMMEQVVAQLLAMPDDVLARVRAELTHQLGTELDLAVQVIPALQQLTGIEPATLSLSPQVSTTGIERVVRTAVRSIAEVVPPLVALFDDADHAGVTSLQTFEILGGQPDAGPLAVILTAGHETSAFDDVLDRMRTHGVLVDEIHLRPLEAGAVARIIAAGTGSAVDDDMMKLADAVWRRSGGTPALVLADLWALAAEGSLQVDLEAGAWVWDDRALDVSDTRLVDDAAVGRLAALDDELTEMVVAVAAAGRSCSDPVLCRFLDLDSDEVRTRVDRGVAATVLVRPDPDGDAVMCADEGIRRSVLERLDADARREVEGRVADALIGAIPRGHDGALRATDEQRFTLIRLLADQPTCRTDPARRALYIDLCELAARDAHRSAGFNEALDLQVAAVEALGPTGWTDQHDRMFELHLRAAENALMSGRTDVVDELLADIHSHDPSPTQRVRTMRVLGSRAWTRQAHDVGLDEMRLLLADLGEPLPPRPTWADVAREYAVTRRVLGRRTPESFLEHRPLTDDRVRAAMDAMLSSVHLAYVDQPTTHMLLVLRGVQLTVRHGVTDSSSYFLTAFGMLSLSVPGSMGRALRYGTVGRTLAERSDRGTAAIVAFAHDAFVRHWGAPLGDTIEPLTQAFHRSIESQERGYGLTGGTFAVLHGFLASRPLRTIETETAGLAAEYDQLDEHAYQQRVAVVQQAVADLRTGVDAGPLDGDRFSVSRWLAAKPRRGELAVIAHTLRALVARCVGDDDTFAEATAAAAPLVRTAPGQAVLGLHWFHEALLAADSLGRPGSRAELLRRRVRAERTLRRLRSLARHAPANADHRVALVEATIAGHTGGRSARARAMEAFDDAISLATRNGVLYDLATAAERAARFHAHSGRHALARHYARVAHDAWEAWGAVSPAETIGERLPDQLGWRAITTSAAVSVETSDEDSAADLTADTLAEASSLLGQELEVRDFLERLIEILMRHTQATRGFLVLQSANGPLVEVAGHLDGDAVVVTPLASPDLSDHRELCVPVVNYVLRTRQVLPLVDPASDRRFRSDVELRRRSPRALLGLPVGRPTATSGVLVLESDTYSHAFEPERIEALRVLSAQAISTIDQARLTSDLTILADDVAQLRATATDLTQRAETDALTGAANRAGMESRLHAAIRAAHHASPDGTELQVGVLFCDLDDFKFVNDQWGHAAGDRALVEIAARLHTATRQQDIVARIGGDEFVVVAVGVAVDELERMAARALAEVARPIHVDPHGEITVSVSIGLGRADLDEVTSIDDVDALVRAADRAMYRAKDSGKNQIGRD